MASPKNTKHISELTPDPMNARRHTPRGIGTIERSIQRDGFGRPIVVSRDYVIAAGNATTEAATNVGMEEILIIDSDGTRPIAIRRTDIESGTSAFVNLAIADNRASEHSDFDHDMIEQLAALQLVDTDEFWFPDELTRMSEDDGLGDTTDTPNDADVTEPGAYFAIIVEAASEREQTRLLERFASEGLSCRALMS